MATGKVSTGPLGSAASSMVSGHESLDKSLRDDARFSVRTVICIAALKSSFIWNVGMRGTATLTSKRSLELLDALAPHLVLFFDDFKLRSA